ncbi:efflux RND transporter permease subunit [Candidatus Symbiobacter mobilis]|uniref:Multidrug efflux pump n=1 Tax=Candidatus Symbiobacter mobilis CR TaxID=946483 RepID=U5N4Z1_9BURK|nr:efflux RND transporter permease subunit [Candidatus Symbiobacter mobilis]AGX86576.1 multidrug efflux pump [Candidatus Symbiobacter mobilis CR]
MWFTRVSLANPVLATMVMLALVVLGLFSLQRLQVDQFPNVDFPVVVVTTEYPGASAEIVESEVSKKIEEGVNAIAGIQALTSNSYENQSVVVIEFGLHIDGRKAADDVREKVATLRASLRDEVKEPRVLRFDPASRPIWSVAVSPKEGSAWSPVELTVWAEQTLKKRLENVRGVGAVTLVGGTWREIGIHLDPLAMEAYHVTADMVVAALSQENQDIPVGAIRSTKQDRLIQIAGRINRPEDFSRLIIASNQGTTVRLGQVATVVDGASEVDSLALYNGQRTLLLEVQKSQDENTIQVVDGLYRTIETLRAELPEGVELTPITDGARQIRVAVSNVRQTLFEGAMLTILIVFLFLNSWRSTVITGLTLPIALIGTFYVMHLLGFTINMITMMALSLCVGLLIDDAIVVRENIVRHVRMGKDAFSASMDGTQEIGLAVLATTLSIVAVFLPIGFMGGIIGKFFHEFGITIVAAVLISMFVSFTLDPMLSSIWHDPLLEEPGTTQRTLYDRTIGRVTGWFDHATETIAQEYQALLRKALHHKAITVLLAIGVFVASVALLPLLGTEFVPKSDFSEITLSFHTPVGSALEVTEAKARAVDDMLRAMPEVRYTLTTINVGSAQGKNYANTYVRLHDRKHRTRSVEAMSILLRERLRQVAGVTVTHVGLRDPVGGQKQIMFSILGSDQGELARLNALALEKVRAIPGLVDIDSSLENDKPTLDIDLDRDLAADLGLTIGQVGSALRTQVAGVTVGNWRAPDDQTYDVVVRLPPALRVRPADVERLPLANVALADGSVQMVRLNQVAHVRESTGSNRINRRDLTREVSITGNVSGRSAGEVSEDIRKAMDSMALPPGYSYKFSGSVKDMAEAFGYALSALVLAVIFIYMILASQFHSFLQPLALMTSLPLTLIGVVLALMLFHSTLSLFSVIGIVMLMGLVTKNAILLVDFAIRAQADGMERNEALLLAARVRLRPILMTTLAMVFGMLPLALALSEGSEMRAPMGQAVIGGVITSSLLTLVVVPVVYCLLDDVAKWKSRWYKKRGT